LLETFIRIVLEVVHIKLTEATLRLSFIVPRGSSRSTGLAVNILLLDLLLNVEELLIEFIIDVKPLVAHRLHGRPQVQFLLKSDRILPVNLILDRLLLGAAQIT